MKVYIYELMYIPGLMDNGDISCIDGCYSQCCGFFTSLAEVRRYIESDESDKENYQVFRHRLNPKTEEDQQPIGVKF